MPTLNRIFPKSPYSTQFAGLHEKDDVSQGLCLSVEANRSERKRCGLLFSSARWRSCWMRDLCGREAGETARKEGRRRQCSPAVTRMSPRNRERYKDIEKEKEFYSTLRCCMSDNECPTHHESEENAGAAAGGERHRAVKGGEDALAGPGTGIKKKSCRQSAGRSENVVRDIICCSCPSGRRCG